ncbi:hypothetical protein, partial [Limnobacter litoralis]|uniref:hypothetical protein n=1 Tax=Limnobacter litoralis TaxID=481366 RepID=UPI0024E16337
HRSFPQKRLIGRMHLHKFIYSLSGSANDVGIGGHKFDKVFDAGREQWVIFNHQNFIGIHAQAPTEVKLVNTVSLFVIN